MKKLVPVTLVMMIISSCVPQYKLEYVRGKENISVETVEIEKKKIRHGDALYIQVSSFDDVSYNFFSNQSVNASMNYGNEVSISLVSYKVDIEGEIDFPILGKVKLEGKNLFEASDYMEELFADYFNQPTVIVKFVNQQITILGEVNRPGKYIFTEENINIFDALGLAGDITIFGNRKNIYLIRENEGKVTKEVIDLTNDNILNGKNFYVKADDIIYVKPLRSRQWSIVSTPYDLILSTITTLLLVLNLTNK